MYKIMLVDDERLVLKSLVASIDWDSYGFVVQDCAASASEAIDKIKKHHYDLIFTDINMPEISGLELIQMIRGYSPETICVIISGYAEFAYTQKAIKYDVIGYCLKPFDYDEIVYYLKKAKKMLAVRNALTDKPEDLKIDTDRNRTGQVILSVEDMIRNINISSGGHPLRAIYAKGYLEADLGKCMLFFRSGTDGAIMIDTEDHINGMIRSIMQKTEDQDVYLGLSQEITAVQDIKKQINIAKMYAYQFFCQPDCERLITDIEITGISQIGKLQWSVEIKDMEKIDAVLNEIRNQFSAGCFTIDVAVLIRNLMETWLSECVSGSSSGFVWEYEQLCEEYENGGHMLDVVREELASIIRGNIYETTNTTLRPVFEYIDNHFSDQLTSPELANRFHINHSYLSSLFRKETGRTFTEYLTNKRMEYACVLLRTTNLSIARVSEKSGFKDYFYFAKIFRRFKNCTPREYRNNSGI